MECRQQDELGQCCPLVVKRRITTSTLWEILARIFFEAFIPSSHDHLLILWSALNTHMLACIFWNGGKVEKFLCPCNHRSPPALNGIDNIRRRGQNEEEEEEESEPPLEAIVIPRDSEGSFPSQSTRLMIVYTLESVFKSLLCLCFSLSQHEYQCHHERGCSS